MKSIFLCSFLIFLSFVTACQETPPPAPPTPLVAATPAPAPTISGEMKATPSGVKYQDLAIGEGQRPLWGQTVKVQYVGKLLDGNIFEQGKYEFKLGDKDTLKGFNIGIGGGQEIDAMKIGGQRVLILPPDLAYGEQGSGKLIPPNATLRFEIELLEVKGTKAF